MKITRHSAALLLAALFLVACACAWLPGPSESEIQLTNEAVLATNEAITTAVVATLTAEAAAAETPSPAMTMTPAPLPISTLMPDIIDFHLQISDGNQPLEASVSIYWPEIGGELFIGPTSDTVISLPSNADGVPIVLTVSADGYLDVVQPLTPTKRLVWWCR